MCVHPTTPYFGDLYKVMIKRYNPVDQVGHEAQLIFSLFCFLVAGVIVLLVLWCMSVTTLSISTHADLALQHTTIEFCISSFKLEAYFSLHSQHILLFLLLLL